MQICIARMLQESGIFFAVSLFMLRGAILHLMDPYDSSWPSWVWDSCKACTHLTLRMVRVRSHSKYAVVTYYLAQTVAKVSCYTGREHPHSGVTSVSHLPPPNDTEWLTIPRMPGHQITIGSLSVQQDSVYSICEDSFINADPRAL